MRLILDTNVLISVWLWHGAPHVLLGLVRDGVASLIVSPQLLDEFADVTARAKFSAILQRIGISSADALAELRKIAEVVTPPPLERAVCRDPNDDYLLALADAANADLLVSGDHDLLSLGAFNGVPIVSPAVALALLKPLNP